MIKTDDRTKERIAKLEAAVAKLTAENDQLRADINLQLSQTLRHMTNLSQEQLARLISFKAELYSDLQNEHREELRATIDRAMECHRHAETCKEIEKRLTEI